VGRKIQDNWEKPRDKTDTGSRVGEQSVNCTDRKWGHCSGQYLINDVVKQLHMGWTLEKHCVIGGGGICLCFFTKKNEHFKIIMITIIYQ
jgi:hypothetical protein